MMKKMRLPRFDDLHMMVWTSLVLAGVTTISLVVAVISGMSLLE
ncbi:hypothetical protein LFE_1894 [Leptospirillum ferrooxidans C2-3]|jgi:hypothetical protein|uniref:Uncharacterized protein n=1 Tax=Leptospirillum ferrooxidans (strain C2-3) TaxID=1162668 RepID=I0IQM3_LEPFC|nr:hypothetical protein LFE_1894 [Leptospirillum ferrooxidans C2-3]